MGNILFMNDFINNLESDGEVSIQKINIGSEITIEAKNKWIVKGTIEKFEGVFIILRVGNNSLVAISAKTIRNLT